MNANDPQSSKLTRGSYSTVGVIGHIDHGKTSLVGSLTGIETDTHPEEKRRGITIDLGFASFTEDEHTFAFIDVPGHHKYVGNLLAGVSAVDMGLLVVAGDQGIQAQTLEHVCILSSLRVPQLVVAITRIDLASPERLPELREEIEVFLSDFGFRDFPIVATSVAQGTGLEELKRELRQVAQQQRSVSSPATASENLPFRMPIDRVFNIPGRGLVVAGTPWSGKVTLGDKLEIAGQSTELRVREIEIHGCVHEQSIFGVRTAINLAGHDGRPVSRGDELITPGEFPSCQHFLIELNVYSDAKEIKLPTRTQLHSATTSVEARLLGPKRLLPGEQTVVLAETDVPIVATAGQACLMRHPYPVGSFAGGQIIGLCDLDALATAPSRGKSKKDLLELGQQLVQASRDPIARTQAWVRYFGELCLSDRWLRWQTGMPSLADIDRSSGIDFAPTLEEVASGSDLLVVGNHLASADHILRIQKFVIATLRKQAEASDDQWMLEDALLQRAKHLASPAVARFALEQLSSSSFDEVGIVQLNGMLAIASKENQLSKKQRARMDQLLKLYSDECAPPTIKEISERLSIPVDAVQSLARHATQQKILVDLGQGLFFSSSEFQRLCRQLQSLFDASPELSVPTIKDAWGLTRKHVIPLLEYCDRLDITQRKQDSRIAGKNLCRYAELQLTD